MSFLLKKLSADKPGSRRSLYYVMCRPLSEKGDRIVVFWHGFGASWRVPFRRRQTLPDCPEMTLSLTVTDSADPADVEAIGRELTAFNDADVGPSGRRPVVVLVRDEAGDLKAGVSGYTAWGWLYVQWLFVAPDLRGQQMAGKMLTAAEDEARRRGCHGAFIDTFNPAAETAYRRQGYEIFGELPDFPPGRRRLFLQKKL